MMKGMLETKLADQTCDTSQQATQTRHNVWKINDPGNQERSYVLKIKETQKSQMWKINDFIMY